MHDFNNMHQIGSYRSSTTKISTFLIVVVCFIVFLIGFATCVMTITFIRRKLKQRESVSLICRSETSETLIESTLINNNNGNNPTIYRAIDV